jgi:hypothetical protein
LTWPSDPNEPPELDIDITAEANIVIDPGAGGSANTSNGWAGAVQAANEPSVSWGRGIIPIDIAHFSSDGLVSVAALAREKLFIDGKVRIISEQTIRATYSSGEDVYTAIKNKSQNQGFNAAAGFTTVSLGINYAASSSSSTNQQDNYNFATIIVYYGLWTEELMVAHSSELVTYLTEAIKTDIARKEDPKRMLAEFGAYVPTRFTFGGAAILDLRIAKSAYSSIAEATSAISATASYLESYTIGGGFSNDSAKMAQMEYLSSHTEAQFTLIGGDALRQPWLNVLDFLAGLPVWAETIKDAPALCNIPNFSGSTIPLWSLVSEIDPALGAAILEAYIDRASDLALKLDASFGGWMVEKSWGPGSATFNYTPSGLARLYLFLGGAGGQTAGDYLWQVNSGFPWFTTNHGYNIGDDGGPGGGVLLSYYARNPFTLNLSIGAVGRSGTNTAGTNTNGVGGLGDSGGNTSADFTLDETTIHVEAYGGPGGGRGNNKPSGSLSPAEGFPGMIEFVAASGTGLTGATIKGIKIGGDANSQSGNGKVLLRILDLE